MANVLSIGDNHDNPIIVHHCNGTLAIEIQLVTSFKRVKIKNLTNEKESKHNQCLRTNGTPTLSQNLTLPFYYIINNYYE
jgi:hypothetical protein